MWKRPVRDRDTTSCPLIVPKLKFEWATGHQADRWIKGKDFAAFVKLPSEYTARKQRSCLKLTSLIAVLPDDA